ncbi:MAG: hypothetical protein JWO83_3094 [Caulobacteraceae bacterium]|nr:hypothetical protein [Caulobacteraceae bacterium]
MARPSTNPPAPGPFTGFGAGALPFYEALAANQNRDWFQANKDLYETQVRAPLAALVEALSFAFAAHDIPLTGDPKRALFRIHRDVRFSKDKSPYKTNAGAVITRDGAKGSPGLLYIQVGGQRDGGQGSFIGIGFYGLEPKDLGTVRHAIADEAERWLAIRSGLSAAGLDFSMGYAMARLPKGFEAHAGSPVADALRLRNFIVSRPIAADRLQDPTLIDDIVSFASAGLPLLRFGWSALDRARGQAAARIPVRA